MIFTNINTNYQEQGLHPIIVKALDYLKENNFKDMEPGTYEIDGKDMFANLVETTTQDFSERRPESHLDYIDIQYVVEGREKMGITFYKKDFPQTYYEQRDVIDYDSVDDESYIIANKGDIAIFFPEDVHRPQIAVDEPSYEKKLVVKLKVSLLK